MNTDVRSELFWDLHHFFFFQLGGRRYIAQQTIKIGSREVSIHIGLERRVFPLLRGLSMVRLYSVLSHDYRGVLLLLHSIKVTE